MVSRSQWKQTLKRSTILTCSLTGLHKPYRKPNDVPMYVHAQSNHPPTVLKHIPSSIGKRISSLSANKDVFDNASVEYDEALRSAGHKETIIFNKNQKDSKNKNNRGRKVTWFNPPYSLNVKTNIGKTFLHLIDRHFPSGHPLHKIFNRHIIKVSYSCITNMSNAIKSYNSCVIKNSSSRSTPP